MHTFLWGSGVAKTKYVPERTAGDVRVFSFSYVNTKYCIATTCDMYYVNFRKPKKKILSLKVFFFFLYFCFPVYFVAFTGAVVAQLAFERAP